MEKNGAGGMERCAIGTKKIKQFGDARQGGDAHPRRGAHNLASELGAALKILSQVVAIFGTIMAIVDTLHRW